MNRLFTVKAGAEATLYVVKGRDAESGLLRVAEGVYGGLKKLKGTLRLQYLNSCGY